jgi:hypothetical protein
MSCANAIIRVLKSKLPCLPGVGHSATNGAYYTITSQVNARMGLMVLFEGDEES